MASVVIKGNSSGSGSVTIEAPNTNSDYTVTLPAASGTLGAGDVTGPASATDNAVARFDGTTGKLIKNSAATMDDTGTPTFVAAVNVSGTSSAGANLKLYEDTDNGTNYVSFKAADSIAANVTWTLPDADGTNQQAITTNGSGTLSFTSILSVVAGASAGAVGTYGFFSQNASGGTITAGSDYAGSSLNYHGVGLPLSLATTAIGGARGGTVSGTWKAVGEIVGTGSARYMGSVFLRIS